MKGVNVFRWWKGVNGGGWVVVSWFYVDLDGRSPEVRGHPPQPSTLEGSGNGGYTVVAPVR